MKWSYKLGSIHGIPIKLHVTFLLILLAFIWIFAVQEFKIFGIFIGFGGMNIPTWLKYLFSAIASVLFFSTVLYHELSHSLVARSYGIKIRGITLFALGGVAQMEDIPRDPEMEAKMAAAGPAFSLAIGIFSYAIYYFFGPVSPTASEALFKNAALIVVGIIAFYNLILGLFNLIPAFPMDGGRILRALFAMRMPYIEATKKAVAVGKSVLFAMAIVGLLFGYFMLILIAIYLYFAASGEERATVISATLEGFKIRDVMTTVPKVVHVPPEWTVNQLVDLMFKTKHMGYPVQDSGASSSVLGVVTFADVRQIPVSARDTTRVEDIMNRELISIGPDADAFAALNLMSRRNVGRLIVMDDGKMVGIVSRTDLIRAIQFRGA